MYRAYAGKIIKWVVGLAVLASAVLQTAGCGNARRVETKLLDDGTTTYTLSNNEIMIEGAVKYLSGYERGRSTVERRCVLDVRANERPGEKTTFQFLLTYIDVNALNIEPGRSLEVIADLNSYVLSAGSGAIRTRDPSGQYFTESLSYPVSADVLVTMAEARTVLVIVKGREGDAKAYFDKKNFTDFRCFVDDYVRPR